MSLNNHKYTGIFRGSNKFPYPGTKPQAYIDTIKYSETVNNQLIFTNLAGNIGTNIYGIIEPISIYGPIIIFEDQTTSFGTFSFDFEDDTVSTVSTNKSIIYYKLTSEEETSIGQIYLNRY